MQPLAWRQSNLCRLNTDNPDYELSLLLEHITGLNNAQQRISSRPLSAEELQRLETYLLRRIAGEPMAYILGTQAFYDIELRVNPHTLIPRPDTEILVEAALEKIPRDAAWQIADLGTGSGAIAISIAKHRPHCRLIAVDKSIAALQTAAENALLNKVDNIQFICANWLDCFVAQSFTVILSNPPYIAANDPHLPALQYEPQSALIAANQGLADLQHIIQHAEQKLTTQGYLLVEHGWQQAAALQTFAAQSGKWQDIHSRKDYGGNERITLMQKS